jgi:SAM-dependent methyltransferase
MPLWTEAMFEILNDILERPEPFSRYTADELWTRPYLAKQMLSHHLDHNSDLASRNASTIEQTVDWINSKIKLPDKKLCDLGCGPGLYAQRFCEEGARVTGIDFSKGSLDHARSQAERSMQPINYIYSNYLSDSLPSPFDVVTLIYCDFCALSFEQRASLLRRIRDMLSDGGHLVLDVAALAALNKKRESTLIEKQLMNGFWAENDYIGIRNTLIYHELSLSLDRYLIIEANDTWEILNWFQHFTPLSLERELNQAGFEIEQIAGSLTGVELVDESDLIGVISRKKHP